ncbi:hypothetical protein M758_1G138600 [Ceratodon purpureus]|nr:hypothetical protein M758_1G138600 [Ceratodon purpureus]
MHVKTLTICHFISCSFLIVNCKRAEENNLCRRAKSKCSCSLPWPHH